MSSLAEPRIENLSALAKSLLHKIQELFARNPTILDERGRAPADPTQLRELLYPDRPVRYADLARAFNELESAGVVHVAPTSRCRKFSLNAACSQWSNLPAPGADRSADLSTSSPLFTIRQGLSPPHSLKNPVVADVVVADVAVDAATAAAAVVVDAVIEAAAAAGDDRDLIRRLAPYFPRHDVKSCLRRFIKYRESRQLAVTNESFARWMLREETPIIKSATKSKPAEQVQRPDDQPDLFDEVAHRRFLCQLAARKARRQ
jgi:hypothetical protein